MDKKLYLLAELDNLSQEKIGKFEKIITENGFIGKQTKNIPYHITLCSFPTENEDYVISLLDTINEKINQIDLVINGFGLFGLNVLFLNLSMNLKLIELYHSVNKNSLNTDNDFAAHVTLLMDEPENIFKVLPEINKEFKAFSGKITNISLFEFFPKKFIKRIELLPEI